MNNAEKKLFALALFLFALGGISKLGAFNKIYPLESISLPTNNEDYPEKILEKIEVSNNEIATDANENVDNAIKNKKNAKKAPKFPIPINSASKEDLCFIKGIGPSLAQRIIEYRETKGSFKEAKDLEKVKGIGEKRRKSMESFISFD